MRIRAGVRRSVAAGLALMVVAGAWSIGGQPADASTALGSNPIVVENARPGSLSWQIPAPGYRIANDLGGQIKGYASATGVNIGGRLDFLVSVNPAQSYRIAIYRLGWYRGAGGRLLMLTPFLPGIHQAACPSDRRTGLTQCAWRPSYRLSVPRSWVSGLYVAVLSSMWRYQNYVPFTVRDDTGHQPLLVVQPVATYQAYNNYPRGTGKSLYDFNSAGGRTISGGTRAVKVSFDRPYAADGSSGLFVYEHPLVRWLEASGYAVSYVTDVDLHARGTMTSRYRGIIFSGHSEYWTAPMRNAAEAARGAVVGLAFLGANDAYWQARLEPSLARQPNRTLVCYRAAALDPVIDRRLVTVRWRDAPVGRPEQLLLGMEYSNMVRGSAPFVVVNARSWIYAGTRLRDGQALPGLIGGEADRIDTSVGQPLALSRALLGRSPYRTRQGGLDVANALAYVAPSRALVFAAGTLSWNLALGAPGSIDARVQRVTHNVLNRILGLPV